MGGAFSRGAVKPAACSPLEPSLFRSLRRPPRPSTSSLWAAGEKRRAGRGAAPFTRPRAAREEPGAGIPDELRAGGGARGGVGRSDPDCGGARAGPGGARAGAGRAARAGAGARRPGCPAGARRGMAGAGLRPWAWGPPGGWPGAEAAAGSGPGCRCAQGKRVQAAPLIPAGPPRTSSTERDRAGASTAFVGQRAGGRGRFPALRGSGRGEGPSVRRHLSAGTSAGLLLLRPRCSRPVPAQAGTGWRAFVIAASAAAGRRTEGWLCVQEAGGAASTWAEAEAGAPGRSGRRPGRCGRQPTFGGALRFAESRVFSGGVCVCVSEDGAGSSSVTGLLGLTLTPPASLWTQEGPGRWEGARHWR